MVTKDWFGRFIRLLETIQDRYELESIHDTIILWFGENHLLIDLDDILDRIVVDAHAEGVDAILVDHKNSDLIFVQAETVANYDNTSDNFSENKLKNTFEGLRLLLRGDYKGKITPKLENLVDEYHDYDRRGNFKTKVVFIALKQKPLDDKFIELFKKDFPDIEIYFYDCDGIASLYNTYLTLTAPPPDVISFEVQTNILDKDSPLKSRVFTIRGKELARAYSEHKETIFQQNLRYSLGMRLRSINQRIYETSKGEESCKNFWYFNNGITIVCDEIKPTTSGRLINLRKPQIINGAQTTYSLYEAYDEGKLRDDVEVILKVIETSDTDIIENITLYTNSQNAINLRDLCSNDEIQRKLQKMLLDSYQYFYERKRGEFDSLYKRSEDKKRLLGESYRLRVINNENAAQSFLALYLDKPAQSKNEKGRIFLKDEAGFYQSTFNEGDELLPEKFLMSWKLLKYIEMHKKLYEKEYKKAEGLSEDAQGEVYKYDFILHSEYFILNIFKDFLMNDGFNLLGSRDDLLAVVDKIDSNDSQIQDHYNTIKETLVGYFIEAKTDPRYYHNKFFKNEKSIGILKNYMSESYSVEVIS